MNNIFDNIFKHNIAPTYLTGILQARAYRNLKSLMTQTLKKSNLSMTEWAILGLIYQDPTINLKSIALILDVKASLVTNLIKLLITKTFITIKINQTDKRTRQIKLTDYGIKIIPEIEIILREVLKQLLKEVPYTDLLIYVRTLSIISNLKTL